MTGIQYGRVAHVILSHCLRVSSENKCCKCYRGHRKPHMIHSAHRHTSSPMMTATVSHAPGKVTKLLTAYYKIHSKPHKNDNLPLSETSAST